MRRHHTHAEFSVAVYPGSFDPVTLGHLDLVERALSLFDHVILLVAQNPRKAHMSLFHPEMRVAFLMQATRREVPLPSPYQAALPDASRFGTSFVREEDVLRILRPNAQLVPRGEDTMATLHLHTDEVSVAQLHDAATVDFCRAIGARAMLRGLRSVTDFESEFEMAVANKELENGIETVFLVPRPENHFISSSMVREIFGLRGAEAVRRYVPPGVFMWFQEQEAKKL